MEREVRYCTTEDGVRIAYCVESEGPPLLYCDGNWGSFALDHLIPTRKAFFDQVGQGRQLVRYDPRGIGLSQRDSLEFSLPAFVRDTEAVVRAAGLGRFALWADCVSGPIAIAYAADYPEQVTHLILSDTHGGIGEAYPYEAVKGLAELCRSDWRLAAQIIGDMGARNPVADPSKRELYAEIALQLAHLVEQSTEGQIAANILFDAYPSLEVGHLLAEVRARTLVFHHLESVVFPISAGRRLAANIPNAIFHPLEGPFGTIWYNPDDIPVVVAAVNRFLGERPVPKVAPAPTPAVHTVLFTDIESSTALTQRLGDERAQGLVREHNRIVREALKTHGGSEIKHTGDGIMASFGSATKALECAVEIQKALHVGAEQLRADVPVAQHKGAVAQPLRHATRIRVRIGLNAGEPIAEGEDLFGTTVQLARRVCDHAGGGEIVVSNVVRELAAGKGFSFDDLGNVNLKGFDEPVRLFELVWREHGAARRRYPDGLTSREAEVLRLVAAGKSNSEIAGELVLSLRTVERHITNIYVKIGAHGKADATRYALEHGLK